MPLKHQAISKVGTNIEFVNICLSYKYFIIKSLFVIYLVSSNEYVTYQLNELKCHFRSANSIL